jgi:putative DNA primase/helicase
MSRRDANPAAGDDGARRKSDSSKNDSVEPNHRSDDKQIVAIAYEVDRVVEIERLAALESIDYEVVRVEAAKRLGVRTSLLDREVTKKRRALGLETDHDDGKGQAVKIADVLPWHEAVAGDQIATTLAAAAKTYAVLPDTAANAIALWVLHTWLVNKFTISPRLAITSPTKGCGKTTVLRFLNKVVRCPKRAGSISPAALFRVVQQFQPTILLDETEKYIEHGSDLHALLNEGHCKGGTVLRVLGEKLELREFAIFGAVAFARNGRLPDDLEQRSITIEMQRRRPDEGLAELREDRCHSLEMVARMCARWAEDADIDDYDPEMGSLINRNADNWRPLFAIADVIGSDWPDRMRAAAVALTARETESISTMLLADIKSVFDEQKVDRLASSDLVDALQKIEGRPWAEWSKSGKPISPNQLARLLKPFAIVSGTIRTDHGTPKGYYRHAFGDAFKRYLSPEEGFETPQRHNADGTGTSGTFRNATPKTDVADQKCEKPLRHNGSGVVAVQTGGNGREGIRPGVWTAGSCAQCGESGGVSDPLLAVSDAGREVYLHRRCLDAWQALEIPWSLDRRAHGANGSC